MTAAMMEPDDQRVPALDGLRGIAILMVVVYHFYAGSGAVVERSGLGIDSAIAKVIDTGWAGVDLFFVLSGFLITGILLRAKGQTGYFRTFYARRVLRIVPVYYGFLFFLIAILPIFLRDNPDLAILRDNQIWYWLYALNIYIPFNTPTDLGFYGNGHLWSLAVEEQFYLVWPALVLLTPRRMFVPVCAACIAGALLVRVALWNGVVPELENIFSAAMLLPARVDSLAAGALLAALAQSSGGLARYARFGLPALVAATAGIGVIFAARDGFVLFDEWVQTAGFTLTALFGAALLLLVAASGARSKLASAFAHPALRMFGRYSYAMYVVHLQIAFVMVRRLEGADWPLVFGSEVPMRVLFTLMGLAIVTLVGWLSWNLLEKHVLRLKRFFSYERAAAGPGDGRTGIAKPARAEGGS